MDYSYSKPRQTHWSKKVKRIVLDTITIPKNGSNK